MPGFDIREVWYLSVGTVVLQMCVNLFLLRHELRKRLRFDEPEDLFRPARQRRSFKRKAGSAALSGLQIPPCRPQSSVVTSRCEWFRFDVEEVVTQDDHVREFAGCNKTFSFS